LPQNKNGNHGCGQHSGFSYADATLYVLNFAGNTADAAALGLAGASAETGGPTNPVGGSLAFGALVANTISGVFSGAQIPINLYQHNYRGAAANTVGLFAGYFAADLAAKAAGAPPITGFAKDAANAAAGKVASNASGC
jgi:hypothetical protein